MKILRFEVLLGLAAVAALAGPAQAFCHMAPAPIAGAGLGAVALIKVGYRTLKNRIGL